MRPPWDSPEAFVLAGPKSLIQAQQRTHPWGRWPSYTSPNRPHKVSLSANSPHPAGPLSAEVLVEHLCTTKVPGGRTDRPFSTGIRSGGTRDDSPLVFSRDSFFYCF